MSYLLPRASVSSSIDGPLNSVTELPGCSVNWEVWCTKVRVLFIPAVESQAISGPAVAEKLLLPEDPVCRFWSSLCILNLASETENGPFYRWEHKDVQPAVHACLPRNSLSASTQTTTPQGDFLRCW